MVLLEELVEEVLLRFPPSEPACLVRAAFVCKPWCRLVSAPRFRRRFRDLHGAPPVLGVICNLSGWDDGGRFATRLIPTSPACPRRDDLLFCHALDARHGRVLLGGVPSYPGADPVEAGRHLAVWDPVTYGLRALPPALADCKAAVACAAGDGCDHLDCHSGPFVVVALGGFEPEDIWLCVYSSEADSWSEPTYLSRAPVYGVSCQPAALVGNTLYFAIDGSRILRYDLATREASVIYLPETCGYGNRLMTLEDGAVGVARVDSDRDARLSLCLWSMEASPNGDIGWTKIRVIELNKLLPVDELLITPNSLVGFAHGIGVFFIKANDRLFMIDLKSGKVKMVCKGSHFYTVVPYTSFYTPALGSVTIGETSGVDASIG
ncbi:unnamed protein product [Urochloa decumbens]|uniref:F-box domain-containing protein n=1 Tax=Urochloa decumbens TaxID=240449 RepID=A0ABC9GEA3_9POAL